MLNKFCIKDSANDLKIRYHCNKSDSFLPAALTLSSNVCIDQLRSNLEKLFHPRELALFRQITNTDRANEFLLGRYVAKYALALLVGTEHFNSICIDRGTFMQPVLLANESASFDISITHKNNMVAAIAFPKSHPMGIDLEKIEQTSCQILESQMTKLEIQAVATVTRDYLSTLCQLWSIKEAISKVFKTGLTTSFLLYETCKHSFRKDGHLFCCFSNFYQYHAQSWVLDDHVLAVVYPRTATFNLDLESYSASGIISSEKLQ